MATRTKSRDYGAQRPVWVSGSESQLFICTYLPPKKVTLIPFSMKNHGIDSEVDRMFNMGKATMNLPLEEKMQYEQGDSGMSHG